MHTLSTPPCDRQNPDLSNGQLVQVRCKYMNNNLELVEDLDSKRSHLQIPGFSGMAVVQLRPSALLRALTCFWPQLTAMGPEQPQHTVHSTQRINSPYMQSSAYFRVTAARHCFPKISLTSSLALNPLDFSSYKMTTK